MLETLRRSLKRANTRFRKLTKAQQRVAIAKDVISQVNAEKILASSTYFSWGDASFNEEKVADANLDMSECVSQVQCEVCGIGSLFVGAVRLADKLKFADFDSSWSGCRGQEADYLAQWFDDKQLNLVEDYFERNNRSEGEDSPIYGEESDDKRLIMIMENIVSNKGRFNPERGMWKSVPGSGAGSSDEDWG